MSDQRSLETILSEFISFEDDTRRNRRLILEHLLEAIHREAEEISSVVPGTTKGRVGKDVLLKLLESVGELYDEELLLGNQAMEKTTQILTDLMFSLKSFKSRHSVRQH